MLSGCVMHCVTRQVDLDCVLPHTAGTSARRTHFYDIPHVNGVETHLLSQSHVELLV